jgi:hypothetical protein
MLKNPLLLLTLSIILRGRKKMLVTSQYKCLTYGAGRLNLMALWGGVATTVATAPFTVVAYEYASLQAMLYPEVVIVTGESVIPVLDGYYGGSSPGRNFGSIISGYENFTGTNITPEVLRP